MNKDFVKQELRNLMEVINEQQEMVLSHQGKIPQIELDILMGNLRKAYELLMEMNKPETMHKPAAPSLQYPGESLQPEELIARVPEEKIIIPEVTADTRAREEITAALTGAAANVVVHVQPEVVIASVETPVVAAKEEPIAEAVIPLVKDRAREFARPSGKISATASLFDDAPTVAGQFQGATTVRDKIAGSGEDKSIAGKLQQHPVSDLKKSIGINEKFAFINELFDGDLDGYNLAIEQLNNCSNLNAANDVLANQLAPKFNWSNDGTTYVQLRNLIIRRFSA